jgi:predicted nucleic acid-binding protein
MTTFVDTNVLIYALQETSEFYAWATSTLAARREVGPLVICDIVYAELSVSLESVDKTDDAVRMLALERLRFSNESLFRAGKAYAKYKNEHDGPKANVLPDFLIGAQADAENAPLLTANGNDFRTYFPDIEIIVPLA